MFYEVELLFYKAICFLEIKGKWSNNYIQSVYTAMHIQ